MGEAPRPVGREPLSLYRFHKPYAMSLPGITMWRLGLPALPSTFLGISVQVVLPPEPSFPARPSDAQGVGHEILRGLPFRVTPCNSPASNARRIHPQHMASPIPLVLQVSLLPYAHAMLSSCAHSPASRSFKPIHPRFVWSPRGTHNTPQHCILCGLKESLLLLG